MSSSPGILASVRRASGSGLSYEDEVLADSPLAYWHFDSTSGNVMDVTGHGHTGEVAVGVTRSVTGKVGTAFSFASGQFVILGSTSVGGAKPYPSVNGTALTLEAWIKTTATAGTILTLDNTGSVGDRSFQFNLSGGKPSFTKIPNGIVNVTAVAAVNDGTWHHTAATYDGATIKVYVDGVLSGSGAATGSTKGVVTADFLTALSGRSSESPLVGSIDEPAIYTSVLTQARLAAHVAAA